MNSNYCSPRTKVQLVMAGLLCLLGQGLGAVIPEGGGRGDSNPEINQRSWQDAEPTQELTDFLAKKNWILTDGDTVYTEEQWANLHPTKGDRRKRTLAIKPGALDGIYWTGGIVYYSFKTLHLGMAELDANGRKDVRKAMEEISHYTCVKFVEDDNAKNKVNIYAEKAICHSNIGMVYGDQILGLATFCLNQPLIIHELGHCLGLFHEQRRPDRDQYVFVHYKNIRVRHRSSFDIMPAKYTNTFNLPYDYLSIMHYGQWMFANAYGVKTMEAKDRDFKDLIGTVQGLSLLDIKTINAMYQCVSCPIKDSDCVKYHANAFVGKDCRCWCPGPAPADGKPVEYCLQSDINTLGSLDFDYCVDKSDDCWFNTLHGRCVEQRERFSVECAKTCKMC